MSDARKRAEEALRMFDQTATPEPHEVYLYRAIAALREILAEENERGAEPRECLCRCPETPGTHTATRCWDPAPPAADEVREAAFARFGRALLPKWWDDGNPGDIDGGDAQEAAEACGLWHHVERHSDDVECEWCGNDGSPCGELTEVGLSALAALRGEVKHG